MPPLRVLHIDTMKGWRGGERQACLLAGGLRARGLDVGFACQPGSEIEKRLRDAGVRTHPVTFHCEADFHAAWQLASLVRKHKYQIIHMHDSHAHWLGGCAGRISGRPLRIVSRRVDFSINRHGFGLSIIKYRYFADAFIAVSDAVKDALLRDGVPGEMINVVYSGIEVPSKRERADRSRINSLLGTNGTTKIIGAVGSLVGHKGHRHLVEAASIILKDFPEARFVILGEGKLRSDLEKQVRQNGLSDMFFMPGYIPSAASLIGTFDVFVMPSVMEGLGSSILDAMASNTPVVATRAGGIPEIIEDGHTGFLAQPGDAKSLAAAVGKALRNRARTKKITDNAMKKLTAMFTVNTMIDKTAELYTKLLMERR